LDSFGIIPAQKHKLRQAEFRSKTALKERFAASGRFILTHFAEIPRMATKWKKIRVAAAYEGGKPKTPRGAGCHPESQS